MIIETAFEQGSEEWLEARSIVPTASEFGKIITGTGKRSEQMEGYAKEIAFQAVTKKVKPNFSNYHMDRGHQMEPRARALYQLKTGLQVDQVAMIYRNELKKESCSPDGVIFDGEKVVKGLEIKSPELHTHIDYVMSQGLPTIYTPQVQGSMWVCGLDEWDFMSYHPDAKPLLVTVKKDRLYHQSLEKHMKEFHRLKTNFIKQIKEIMEK